MNEESSSDFHQAIDEISIENDEIKKKYKNVRP
jgi:hypothetical protein